MTELESRGHKEHQACLASHVNDETDTVDQVSLLHEQ